MRFKKKHSRKACRVVELEIMKKVIKPWIFEENQWILSYSELILNKKCLTNCKVSGNSVVFLISQCDMGRIVSKVWSFASERFRECLFNAPSENS